MIRRRPTEQGERGFTLMETMIALGVLTTGLLGMVQVMAVSLGMSADSGGDLIAHQKATEAIESVFTARDTRTITWAKIRNKLGETGHDDGVFLDGKQPVKAVGADGLVNTADDGNVEVVMLPGADGQLGTGDDVAMPLSGFERQIEITSVANNPNLRRLRVTVTYRSEQRTRQWVVDTFISSFA